MASAAVSFITSVLTWAMFLHLEGTLSSLVAKASRKLSTKGCSSTFPSREDAQVRSSATQGPASEQDNGRSVPRKRRATSELGKSSLKPKNAPKAATRSRPRTLAPQPLPSATPRRAEPLPDISTTSRLGFRRGSSSSADSYPESPTPRAKIFIPRSRSRSDPIRDYLKGIEPATATGADSNRQRAVPPWRRHSLQLNSAPAFRSEFPRRWSTPDASSPRQDPEPVVNPVEATSEPGPHLPDSEGSFPLQPSDSATNFEARSSSAGPTKPTATSSPPSSPTNSPELAATDCDPKFGAGGPVELPELDSPFRAATESPSSAQLDVPPSTPVQHPQPAVSVPTLGEEPSGATDAVRAEPAAIVPDPMVIDEDRLTSREPKVEADPSPEVAFAGPGVVDDEYEAEMDVDDGTVQKDRCYGKKETVDVRELRCEFSLLGIEDMMKLEPAVPSASYTATGFPPSASAVPTSPPATLAPAPPSSFAIYNTPQSAASCPDLAGLRLSAAAQSATPWAAFSSPWPSQDELQDTWAQSRLSRSLPPSPVTRRQHVAGGAWVPAAQVLPSAFGDRRGSFSRSVSADL